MNKWWIKWRYRIKYLLGLKKSYEYTFHTYNKSTFSDLRNDLRLNLNMLGKVGWKIVGVVDNGKSIILLLCREI